MNFIATLIKNLQQMHKQPILNEVRGSEIVNFNADTLLQMIMQVRTYLRRNNIKAEDRVALLAPNSAHWIAIDLAVIAEGAILVPLYTRSTVAELKAIIADCTPDLIIVADTNLSDTLSIHDKTIATYDDLFQTQSDEYLPTFQNDHDDNKPVTIIYTSGTSGKSKGVILTNKNILSMCEETAKHISVMYSAMNISAPRIYHYLPLCFAGSRLMLWTQLYLGKPTYLGTDLQQFSLELKIVNPHFFLNVPAVLERIKQGILKKINEKNKIIKLIYQKGISLHQILEYRQLNLREKIIYQLSKSLFKKIKTEIGSQLNFLICGSAPLNPATQTWFMMLGIPIYQVYGLTETTGIISIDNPHTVASGYVGFPLSICETALSETGELLCRGPNIFPGYWKQQEASDDCMQDGWFKTGDQAELDKEGRLKILGRSKELLVLSTGHKVPPMTIEERLLSLCHGAEHVIVFGHNRAYLSALITGDLTQKMIDDCLAQLNLELSHYQKIRRAHKLNTAFTIENGLLTANGKLKRNAIEKTHQQIIEDMYLR